MTRRVTAVVCSSLLALATASCGGDDDDSTSTTPTVPATVPATVPGTAAAGDDVVTGEAFPAARCEANRAAGTITYLTGFDYAATASIVEVLVAKDAGYFDQLCLDVEIKAGVSNQNYPFLASNEAQFSSGGSFSELVNYATSNDARFVAMAIEGKTGIDALIVKPGAAATLDDLRGTTIGVKGAITTSVAAMLKQAGLTEGTDYETVLIDGFDPKVHIEIPNIVGFPGYKSNEPLQLEAAGIPFDLFDPAAYDIPGSFGVLYTNGQFLSDHPTAAQDFVRAAMKGLADAVADPKAASDVALGYINASGNAMFLSPEGEEARWKVESGLVVSTNSTTALGVPEPALLTDEVTVYAQVGLFDGTAPDITPYFDAETISAVYDASGTVVWPAAG
ncbi:MAG: ABC transporter substrate-binding protein [Actinobacteria bacterium]|nr:ABC transporter substrate-binding protein [Actinomycetota bacterium]